MSEAFNIETSWNVESLEVDRTLQDKHNLETCADSKAAPSLLEGYKKLEKTVAVQRKEIQAKIAAIFELREKNASLEAVADLGAVEALQQARLDNEGLRKRVAALEAVLAANGLGSYALPNQIDIRALERRVQELNYIAEKDAKRWVSEGAIRQYRELPQIPINFFQNGVQIENHSFSEYNATKAQALLTDLMDGFFPYDLKDEYPDGVPLKIVDRTAEKFVEGSAPSHGVNSQTQTSEVHIKTPANDAASEGRVTTLRVKSETGRFQYCIRMYFTDPIASLQPFLEGKLESNGPYEFRTTFPARTISSDSQQTFQELELVPNYTLMVVSLKS